jgi:hypothetical protein
MQFWSHICKQKIPRPCRVSLKRKNILLLQSIQHIHIVIVHTSTGINKCAKFSVSTLKFKRTYVLLLFKLSPVFFFRDGVSKNNLFMTNQIWIMKFSYTAAIHILVIVNISISNELWSAETFSCISSQLFHSYIHTYIYTYIHIYIPWIHNFVTRQEDVE